MHPKAKKTGVLNRSKSRPQTSMQPGELAPPEAAPPPAAAAPPPAAPPPAAPPPAAPPPAAAVPALPLARAWYVSAPELEDLDGAVIGTREQVLAVLVLQSWFRRRAPPSSAPPAAPAHGASHHADGEPMAEVRLSPAADGSLGVELDWANRVVHVTQASDAAHTLSVGDVLVAGADDDTSPKPPHTPHLHAHPHRHPTPSLPSPPLPYPPTPHPPPRSQWRGALGSAVLVPRGGVGAAVLAAGAAGRRGCRAGNQTDERCEPRHGRGEREREKTSGKSNGRAL